MMNESITNSTLTATNLFMSCKLNGDILYSSSTCQHLLHYDQGEIIGTRIQDYIYQEDLYLVESYFHVPEEKQCNCRFIQREGHVTWVKLHIQKVLNESKDIIEIILNIKPFPAVKGHIVDQLSVAPLPSYPKQVLMKDEHSLFWLLEEAPFGVMINRCGRNVYMNKENATLLGITNRQEWIGKSVLEFVQEDYRDIVSNRIKLIREGKAVGIIEQKWKRINGEELHVEIKSSRTIIQNEIYEYVVINDISSRKQFQEVIQTSRERYRRLVQNSIDTIAVILDDTIVFINDSGVQLFGASSYLDIVGNPVFDFLHSDYHEALKQKLNYVLQEDCEDEISEGVWQTLDGEKVYSEIVAIPITFQQKKAVQIIIRDISYRKEAEKLMLESEKLSIAGQLAAGIAHEIRNPLTAIKGFVQLMKSGVIEKEHYYDIISSELNRIEMILSELLMLAKPHESSFQETNITQLVSEVICLLETQAILHNIRIEFSSSIINE
ncbi:PAS domain S-box protein [Bacillus suaedaesalsae]|uniref:histidine kinase n=1 Tax=Bacillus suaedaesalsae TaxID=2810349 RepID=A0ABS2DGD9_9BACI|nr:PAS domain S-box protein [Bacillus suaedaesalsae]MBM6617543.1 PAS domain S-box protein [Bacillus suaedaesalsae]